MITHLENDPFCDALGLMISKENAKTLAMREIHQIMPNADLELIIVDDETIEKDFGWVFFWTTKKFIETDDIRYALGGNCPIIVNKFDASTHLTGTAYEIDHYIREYEASQLK